MIAAVSLAEQFAIVRLSIAKKENDEFEAIRDRYQSIEQCEAFCDLVEDAQTNQRHVSNEIIRDSLRLIIRDAQGGGYAGQHERSIAVEHIVDRWRALGAGASHLKRFGTLQGSQSADRGGDPLTKAHA